MSRIDDHSGWGTLNPLRWLWNQVLGDDDEPRRPDQLVLLGEPPGEIVAQMWRSKLAAEGIEALVKNVSSLAFYGVPSFQVLVRYKDFDAAREVLNLDPWRAQRRSQHNRR